MVDLKETCACGHRRGVHTERDGSGRCVLRNPGGDLLCACDAFMAVASFTPDPLSPVPSESELVFGEILEELEGIKADFAAIEAERKALIENLELMARGRYEYARRAEASGGNPDYVAECDAQSSAFEAAADVLREPHEKSYVRKWIPIEMHGDIQ